MKRVRLLLAAVLLTAVAAGCAERGATATAVTTGTAVTTVSDQPAPIVTFPPSQQPGPEVSPAD